MLASVLDNWSGVIWGHLVVAVMTAIALLALLLSRQVRDFVNARDSGLIAH
jgi:hypothetical protein